MQKTIHAQTYDRERANKEFVRIARVIKRTQHWKTADLAEELHLNPQHLSAIMRAVCPPPLQAIGLLAQYATSTQCERLDECQKTLYPQIDTSSVGYLIFQARDALGSTMEVLAERLKSSVSAIADYENNKRTPSQTFLIKLASLLSENDPIHIKMIAAAQTLPPPDTFKQAGQKRMDAAWESESLSEYLKGAVIRTGKSHKSFAPEAFMARRTLQQTLYGLYKPSLEIALSIARAAEMSPQEMDKTETLWEIAKCKPDPACSHPDYAAKKAFGNALRTARKTMGKTQFQLAEAAHVPKATLAALETAEPTYRPNNALKLIKHLDDIEAQMRLQEMYEAAYAAQHCR